VVIGTGKLRTNAIGAIIAIFAIPTVGVVAASNVTVFVWAFGGGHSEFVGQKQSENQRMDVAYLLWETLLLVVPSCVDN
jgi:hypothetical protein